MPEMFPNCSCLWVLAVVSSTIPVLIKERDSEKINLMTAVREATSYRTEMIRYDLVITLSVWALSEASSAE